MIISLSISVVFASSIAASELTENRNLIVDCLLPGKVRQLGINRTYLSRKRPTKASAQECEIKGGDYEKYDRATRASALAVWQQAAAKGDAQAQYYVGEIFEKGMGEDPDYKMAVSWYQRAIKQNHKPSKMSLGRLYELGLGVEKDLVIAMNLYRQASGLNDEEIAYASVFEELKVVDEQRIASLEAELEQQNRKSLSLTRQLEVMQSDLSRSKDAVIRLKDEIENLKSEHNSAEDAEENTNVHLKAKRDELAFELEISDKLQRRLQETQQALAITKQQLASLAPNATPKIYLKWPPFEESNGAKTSEVLAGSIVNVVGVVRPFNNVRSVKINQQSYQLDANGLFLKSLDIGSDTVELTVEVETEDDKRVTSNLSIVPSNRKDLVYTKSGALTHKKVKFGNYHALVIGNNNYDLAKGWERLDTAVKDATEIAKVLQQQYGFKVRLELDADRDTLLSALEEMRKKLTQDDNLLVYYAGHGLVDPENDQGYWVPVDGTSDSAVRWISNASITDQIRAMNARNIMVIADSCYSGSLMRSGIVTLRSGLSPQKKALRLTEDVNLMTRVALSSGGIQPVIDSIYNSDHSVFAGALLNILKNNKELLDADSLATQVAHAVAIATKDNVKQVPRYAPLAAGGHEGGEFYFAPKEQHK